MNRLARIEHYRCGQPAGKWGTSTYVWVPETMTADELQQHVEAARKSYMDAEEEMKLWQPQVPPGYGATIMPNTPDNKTVGELKAEYEERAKKYKEYQAAAEKARKGFSYHLTAVSGGAILPFWGQAPELNVECDWGHQHGVTVDYSETKIGDYPPTDDEEDV
jgi:hypothetical protein